MLLVPHAALPDATSADDVKEAVLEAGSLASLLRARHAALALALDAGFPELKASVWQSEGAVQGAVQALTPQMTENRKKVGCRSMANLGSTHGLLGACNSWGHGVEAWCRVSCLRSDCIDPSMLATSAASFAWCAQ